MFDLSGKNALITGASGGIGKAVATLLHKQGARVIISGRNEENLKNLAAELKDNVEILVSDLSDKEQVDNLISKAESLVGNVDILVCNAGVTQDNITLRMKESEWDHVINTNLSATFALNKNALKKMFKNRFGRIINITSVVGITGNSGQANYAASKAGIIGMSKSIAQESASRNVTINCIAPGFIKTPMTDILSDDQKAKILGNIPAGKLGDANDIAYAVLYLASAEAAYITGQTLHVNGGMLMV